MIRKYNDKIVLIQVYFADKSQRVFRGYSTRKVLKQIQEEYKEIAQTIDEENIPSFKGGLSCLPTFNDANNVSSISCQHSLTTSSISNISIQPTTVKNTPTQSKEEIWGIITLLYYNLKQQIDDKKTKNL